MFSLVLRCCTPGCGSKCGSRLPESSPIGGGGGCGSSGMVETFRRTGWSSAEWRKEVLSRTCVFIIGESSS